MSCLRTTASAGKCRPLGPGPDPLSSRQSRASASGKHTRGAEGAKRVKRTLVASNKAGEGRVPAAAACLTGVKAEHVVQLALAVPATEDDHEVRVCRGSMGGSHTRDLAARGGRYCRPAVALCEKRRSGGAQAREAWASARALAPERACPSARGGTGGWGSAGGRAASRALVHARDHWSCHQAGPRWASSARQRAQPALTRPRGGRGAGGASGQNAEGGSRLQARTPGPGEDELRQGRN